MQGYNALLLFLLKNTLDVDWKSREVYAAAVSLLILHLLFKDA